VIGLAMVRAVTTMVLAVALVLPMGRTFGEDALPFVRVIVPAAGVRDVPRGDGRYVPLPLAEFEESVARLGGSSNLQRPVASSADYTLAPDGEGELQGSLTFTIEDGAGGIPSELPLGRASVGRCTIRTPEGSGEAVVYGLPDGRVAVRTAGPGEYSASIRVPASSQGARFPLPLVPALTTTVNITLPETLRPFVVGQQAASVSVEKVRAGQWRFITGPADSLPLVFYAPSTPRPALKAWNTLSLRGRQADVTTILEPVGVWGPGTLEVLIDPSIRVARVTADGLGDIPWVFHPPALAIDLPPSLVGSSGAVVVAAVAPRSADGQWTVPIIRPRADQWAVAGTRLDVDPALAIGGIELDQCIAISEDASEGWPRIPTAASGRPDAARGPRPARLALEHQAPNAVARVVLGPRTPVFDTARVTTVDISPGTVLGRANCDVRVVSGEAFEIVGDIAAGWIIDSVEAVDFSARAAGEPTEIDAGQIDWRVVRSQRANELRIGLARAATPQRSLGLRITGHRVGLPLGAEFTTAELDMVRLMGEASGMALLEFRVGATAVVEVAGTAMGLEPAEGRLAALTGDTPPRARIRTGERSPPVRARLVRRRPPVAADVQLALTARDERLAEAFTFACRPVSGELDALVIHFSEPLGEGLEWSLVDPPGSTLVARPLAMRGGSVDAAEEAAALGLSAGDQAAAAFAESWLVELRPATTSSVTIRASRTVPLEAAVPVPLAWVEAAEKPGGLVAVRGGQGRRPEIINRRLRELPPPVEGQDTALVELAYGSPESVASSDGLPPADVLPPAAAAGARAWAWHETTLVWCHESGHLEWQTTIDLENQGRDELTLSVPPGLSLESVEVQGERIALEPIGGREGVSVPLPLPSQRGRLTLDLRGSAEREADFGWWTIGGVTCGIDVPVLDRHVRLYVPPGLDATGQVEADQDAPGWAERLFGSHSTSRGAEPSTQTGFRGIPITSVTRGGVADIQIVRRDVVVSLSVLAAVVMTLASFGLARRSGIAAVACCVVAAGGALWCEPPWYAVPRAAWWGCLVGTWLAGCRLPTGAVTVPLTLLTLLTVSSQATAQVVTAPTPTDAMPLRVFVTPDEDGGTALVPEQLFKRLTNAMTGLPPVRVMASDIEFQPAAGRCSITLDIDADRGGSLVADQRGCGGVWITDLHESSPGVVVAYSAGDAEARLTATVAGRHRVTLVCRPGTVRQGDVTIASVCLPAAARAMLHMTGLERPADTTSAVQCERSNQGTWVPAARTGGNSFDVAGAERVRIVRPVNSRDRLASEFRTAMSANDIDWLPLECRVTATFDVGGEREIVRSLVVRTDPDLEPVAVGDEPLPRQLGGGRWLLERPQARAGAARFSVAFRRVLPEPVGVFVPPSVWLEGVANDARTVRLRPAPVFDATVELPLGMTLGRPKLEDGPTTTTMWRQDATAGNGEALATAGQPSVRITVRRRDVKPRGTQEVVVQFDENGVGIRLRSSLEAMTVPLVEIPVELPPSAVIDRVSLVREFVDDKSATKPEGIDIAWSRVAADRIVVIVQRPLTGKFRFELDARQVIRPVARGRVPIARVVTGGDLPLTLTCRSTPPLTVMLVGEPGEVMPFLADRFDVASGEPAPNYELDLEPVTEQDWVPDRVDGTPAREGSAGVDLTRVDLAIDRRGRCRGLVRFDLVAPQPVVTLRLPAGMRLFDVRVDGREVTAAPRDGSAWDVRLHDISWPRTLVAVISGSVGGRFADGEPIRLEPPIIDGLEPGHVLWSIETPVGFRVRVSMPSRAVGEREWREREGERNALQQEAFTAAIAAGSEADGVRLRAFASARQVGAMPAGERAWYTAWQSGRDAEPVRTRIVAGENGAVTLRAAVVVPMSVAGRGLATALLVSLVLGGWQIVRRFPMVGAMVVPIVHRGWWIACGLAWIFFLESSLPGWCMLALGIWVAWPSSWRRWVVPSPDVATDITANASTRTVMPR
jgi:hypothetical protein